MDARLAILGGAAVIRPSAGRAADLASHLGVPLARRADVELAVHEVLANALEHGHLGDPELPIDLEVAREEPATVTVRIADRALAGRWDPPPRPSDATSATRERGRGRPLIHHLAEEVRECGRAGSTTVTLGWSTSTRSSVVRGGSWGPSAGRGVVSLGSRAALDTPSGVHVATLVLVRHATTAATGKRLGGWTPGVHLDEAGVGQAEATAERLAEQPIAAVYASPLERTQDTARILAKPHGLRVRTRRGLGEVDYGDWTDKPLGQLRRRKAWEVVQRTPSRMSFPGGESIRAAQARAVEETERLAAEHPDETVVCVSHADVIKAVVAHHLGMPLDAFQRLVISPASATVLHLPEGGHPLLLRFNDTGPMPAPSRNASTKPNRTVKATGKATRKPGKTASRKRATTSDEGGQR